MPVVAWVATATACGGTPFRQEPIVQRKCMINTPAMRHSQHGPAAVRACVLSRSLIRWILIDPAALEESLHETAVACSWW